MAENIKLKHIAKSYKIDKQKKTVVCFGTFGLDASDNTIDVIGVAKCRKEDEFNEKVGKQVARAKCEKKAFSIYAEVLKEQIIQDETYLNDLKYTYEKMLANIKHQKEYLKTF